MLPRVMGVLFRKIMGSQHHGLVGLCLFFEELTRCSPFNDFPQPHKLIYALICLHVTPAFKIVHRCGTDRAQYYFALIEHRELNDRPIKVVLRISPCCRGIANAPFRRISLCHVDRSMSVCRTPSRLEIRHRILARRGIASIISALRDSRRDRPKTSGDLPVLRTPKTMDSRPLF
jgi:hypothetical protein